MGLNWSVSRVAFSSIWAVIRCWPRRFCSRIRQHFGIDIPLRSLLEEPTVAGVRTLFEPIEQTFEMLSPTAPLASATTINLQSPTTLRYLSYDARP